MQGFSLIEMLIAELIVICLLVGAAELFLMNNRMTIRTSQKHELESQVSELFLHILRTGRLANSCNVGSGVLKCVVQRGGGTNVQFRWVDRNPPTEMAPYVVFEEKPPSGNVFVEKLRYRGISSFTLCDFGRSCPIPQSQLTAANKSNRYFRFRIEGATQDGFSSFIQSAFFVRNPTGLLGVNSLSVVGP